MSESDTSAESKKLFAKKEDKKESVKKKSGDSSFLKQAAVASIFAIALMSVASLLTDFRQTSALTADVKTCANLIPKVHVATIDNKVVAYQQYTAFDRCMAEKGHHPAQ